MKFIENSVCAPIGFLGAGIHAGIRKNPDKKDLAIIFCTVPCVSAAVYTTNKVKGAPIVVTKKHLADGVAQAVIVNSGNANTCNADGEKKAKMMCAAAAQALNINEKDVIVASTGVIGQSLPIEPIFESVGKLAEKLSGKEGAAEVAQAIITTDTRTKECAVEFELGGKICRIGAVAKGSGMIHPNMATMLCFITTDVQISKELLKKAIVNASAETFNMISVDGDTSTNDMVSIMASGGAGNEPIYDKNEAYKLFCNALLAICTHMAKELARDGEGATKLIQCKVSNAKTLKIGRIVAKSVITSNLFKAAMFGEDANWGRILCAIGYAPAVFNINRISVSISSSAGEVAVCAKGVGVPFSEELAPKVLAEDEITIAIDMKSGKSSATAYGCDLTYDYVKINGDYRS